jgi:hypothetical protein
MSNCPKFDQFIENNNNIYGIVGGIDSSNADQRTMHRESEG